MKKRDVEKLCGGTLVRGWYLDGAGPARFGWARIDACKVTYLGKTLTEVACHIQCADASRGTGWDTPEGWGANV